MTDLPAAIDEILDVVLAKTGRNQLVIRFEIAAEDGDVAQPHALAPERADAAGGGGPLGAAVAGFGPFDGGRLVPGRREIPLGGVLPPPHRPRGRPIDPAE